MLLVFFERYWITGVPAIISVSGAGAKLTRRVRLVECVFCERCWITGVPAIISVYSAGAKLTRRVRLVECLLDWGSLGTIVATGTTGVPRSAHPMSPETFDVWREMATAEVGGPRSSP